MKNKKCYIMIGAVLLAVALVAGSGFLLACGPQRFCGRGFHSGFHGPGFREHVLAQMDTKVGALNLTEEQKAKYDEIKETVSVHLADMAENRKALFKTVEEEINREKPDINRLGLLVKERLRTMPEKMEEHVDTFVAFYGMLDEEQQAKIIRQFKEKMNRFKSMKKHHLDT